MKNRYFIRSRILEAKFREIIKLFAGDLTACQRALFSGVSRMCVNRILKQVRIRIAEFCEKGSLFKEAEVERDESYFGACRIRGRRGRGFYGKTILFGLKQREGRVYTDGFKTYEGLVNRGYKKYYRVHHGKNEFAKKEKKRIKNHINGIENFWGLAKVRLSKFRGMNKDTFYLHLKEGEFRFNHRKENLYTLILKRVKNKPLKVS